MAPFMTWLAAHPWVEAFGFLTLVAVMLVMWWEITMGGWDDD